MRIAFVSLMASSPWGASEVLWSHAARLALQAGHATFISVYDRQEPREAVEQLQRDGAVIHLRPLESWRRRSALWSRLTGVFLPLRDFQPDVICINQGGTYDIARGGSTSVLRSTVGKLGAPFILLCHCEQPAPSGRKLNNARRAFQDAAIVGVLAHRLRTISEEHLGLALCNARIFHNPVNLPKVGRMPWPVASSPLRLAFVGRLEPVKNLEALLQALSSAAWRGRDWSLTICGSGADRYRREQQVQHAYLNDKVHFAGHVDDITAVWATHHALVMPSKLEGVPLAMIEAMLCGRPVAATNTGGISEWLRDDCGFLINGATANEVGAALERLWSRRQQLEALGRNAHTAASSKRDPDPARTLFDWLEQVYARCKEKSNDPTRSI